MHWSGSLVLFIVVFLLGAVLALPLQLHVDMAHQKSWKGTLTISCLWARRTAQFPRQGAEQTENQAINQKTEPATNQAANQMSRQSQKSGTAGRIKQTMKETIKERMAERGRRTSFQIVWRDAISFLRRAIPLVTRHLELRALTVHCRIGFHQPDWTAYSYGLFWTVLSLLPEAWLTCGDFTYQPDFQQARQEIQLQGIIQCKIGQLILIVLSLFWLTVQTMLEQNRTDAHQRVEKRREPMVYES